MGSGDETGFMQASRSGSDDMSRSVVRVIEPARLQLSQEIAIFTRSEGDGASSNAASKAA